MSPRPNNHLFIVKEKLGYLYTESAYFKKQIDDLLLKGGEQFVYPFFKESAPKPKRVQHRAKSCLESLNTDSQNIGSLLARYLQNDHYATHDVLQVIRTLCATQNLPLFKGKSLKLAYQWFHENFDLVEPILKNSNS